MDHPNKTRPRNNAFRSLSSIRPTRESSYASRDSPSRSSSASNIRRLPKNIGRKTSSSRRSSSARLPGTALPGIPSQGRTSPSDGFSDSFDILSQLGATEHLALRLNVSSDCSGDSSKIFWLESPIQSSLRVEFMRDINRIRAQHRLRGVTLDPVLNEVAADHNYDQAYVIKSGTACHEGSDGALLEDRLDMIEYPGSYAGECVARGPDSVRGVIQNFMDEAEACGYVLDPRVRVMGFHGGKDANGNWFWTLLVCG